MLAELEQHLALLQRQGLIETWHEGRIAPGSPRKQTIQEYLAEADLILLLISASFLASDRTYDQVEQALRLRNAANVIVLPILLNRVAWESAPFAELQVLPRDKVPVAAWRDRQAAWVEVSESVKEVVKELSSQRSARPTAGRVQSFDAQVAELYRLLRYDVEAGKAVSDEPFDLYLTLNPGDIVIRRAIACRPGPVSLEELDDFARQLGSARRQDPGLLGTIVSGASFTEEVTKRAQSCGVQLITLRELSARLLEGRAYVERLVRELESDPKYPLAMYIQPSIALDNGRGRPALELIQEWLADPEWNQLTLLGDVGTGKTFLSRVLAHRLAREYLQSPVENPLPILVDLRHADRQLSLEGLVLTHLHNHGLPQATFDVFQHALSAGQVVVLFDGFDEMAARVTPQVTTRNFSELARCVRGRAKVLLTCRTHYFRSRSDEAAIILDVPMGAEDARELYWDLVIRKGFQIAYLRPFETWQIEEYVMQVKGDEGKTTLQRIRELYNLMELSRRPMLLEMIVKSIARLREDTNAADLYEAFTNIWIQRDRWRNVLEPDQKRLILTGLAWHLFSSKSTAIHYKDLLEHLARHNPRHANDPGSLVYLDNEVRTASFLVRDEQGNYSFAHKSYAEFFLARHVLNRLGASDESCLDAGLLPIEMLGFLAQMLKGEHRQSIARQLASLLKGPYRKNISENALLCLYGLRTLGGQGGDAQETQTPEKLCLSGAQLDGAHLPGVQAAGAELQGASLADAELAGANLSKTDLRGANLRGADLRGADLSGALLSGARLQTANLEGARLHGALLSGADLTDAILIAATLDGADLASANLSGARLPEDGLRAIKSAEPAAPRHDYIESALREARLLAIAAVRSMGQRVGLPEHMHEDIVSEVLYRLYVSLSEGKLQAPVNPQMIRVIVRQFILDQARRLRSAKREIQLDHAELDLFPDVPDEELLSKERQALVADVLDELNPRARAVVKMRLEGYSFAETAAAQQMSEAGVSMLFARAIARARKMLAEQDAD